METDVCMAAADKKSDYLRRPHDLTDLIGELATPQLMMLALLVTKAQTENFANTAVYDEELASFTKGARTPWLKSPQMSTQQLMT